MDKTTGEKVNMSSKEMMKKVILAAVDYLQEALLTMNTTIKPDSLRLEEITGNANSEEWKLTLSYIEANNMESLSILYGENRVYKDFTVSVDTKNDSITSISITDRVK